MSRVIVTDIEGTTSSISFVRDVLFPYARQALPDFVREHGHEPSVRTWLDAAARDGDGVKTDRDIVALLQGWIDQDRKHTALKALQGMIWKAGYLRRDYVAHVYPDAALKLRQWHAAGHVLYVYSSGSVAAQKLFFAHTEAGNLTSLFSGYFDTETGGKREVASYQRIIAAVQNGLPDTQDKVLFLSDVIAELDAARDAGMDTVLVDRSQDYPAPRTGAATHGHARATSFAGVHPAP